VRVKSRDLERLERLEWLDRVEAVRGDVVEPEFRTAVVVRIGR